MAEPIVQFGPADTGDERPTLAEIEDSIAAVRGDLAARPAGADRADLVAPRRAAVEPVRGLV